MPSSLPDASRSESSMRGDAPVVCGRAFLRGGCAVGASCREQCSRFGFLRALLREMCAIAANGREQSYRL